VNIENIKQVSLPLTAVRLRALVLALGESVCPAWWNTEFMNETGLRFLERLYPRTFFRSAINAAGKAACEIHDRAVGRIGVYHLFRLPETLEIELHNVPPTMNEDFVLRFRLCLNHTDKLMEMLEIMYECDKTTDAVPGPRRIGAEADLMQTRTFQKTASVYYQAFSQNKPGFPYFGARQIETVE